MSAAPRSRLLDAIAVRFRTEFGDPPPRRFFAPGRINLVGAHLDYSGGDVLPMAVDRGLWLAELRQRNAAAGVSDRKTDGQEPGDERDD